MHCAIFLLPSLAIQYGAQDSRTRIRQTMLNAPLSLALSRVGSPGAHVAARLPIRKDGSRGPGCPSGPRDTGVKDKTDLTLLSQVLPTSSTRTPLRPGRTRRWCPRRRSGPARRTRTTTLGGAAPATSTSPRATNTTTARRPETRARPGAWQTSSRPRSWACSRSRWAFPEWKARWGRGGSS